MGITDILNPYRTVESAKDAKDLAKVLIDPQRERPAVVVSTTKKVTFISPTELAKKLGPDVDVYLLESSRVAYDFQDAMPFDTSVYGGAARCYPPGTAWTKNSSLAMVRLAYTDAEGQAAINLLADDVAAMTSYPREAATSTSVLKSADEPVEGTVSVILEPDGVLVQLVDGIARIDTSLIAPGIHPDLIFSHSQKVTGIVRNGILTLTEGFNTPSDAADYAAAGAVVPALVTSAKAVALFPGLTVRHTSEAPEGSVIAVRVELSGRADGKAWKLTTVTDPAEVVEALPFMKDGQPWITWQPAEPEAEPCPDEPLVNRPPRAHGDAFAALDAVHDHIENLTADNARLTRELQELRSAPAEEAIPLPSPAFAGIEVARLRAETASQARQITELTEGRRRAMADADDLGAEVTLLSHTVERLRADVRTERDRADRARQAARETENVLQCGPAFLDPEEQFRHEVYLEWATRIPAASKADLPLAGYELGDGFLESVDTIQGIDRSKIVAVAVEVLTGLADEMPGRDMHRLRGGLPGASYIDDAQLGSAWRVALQINTASARRMHFWRGADGRIVLATVGIHDDMDI